MKVLVVHNNYQSGLVGGEDLVVAREIAGLKSVLGEQNVLDYCISNDDIHRLKLAFTLWGNQTHYENIKSLVLQHRINIVHVHNFFPLLTPLVFVAAKAAGAMVIHTLHNFRWWCVSGILDREQSHPCEKCVNKKFALPAIVHRCYRGSRVQSLAASLAFFWYRIRQYQKYIDAYFALTPFQQEKLKQFGLHQSVYLKPNPIEVPKLLSGHKKDYLFVGRLEATKGIELLLNIWIDLPQDFCLDIIGDSPQRTRLESKFKRSHIRFLGQLTHEEVLKRSQAAKFVIHPSLAYETFGLTLVEALSLGTPVIGLDIGTRKDFIRHGYNGFLCQQPQLKDIILASKDYPNYQQLSDNAMQSARAFYLPKVMEQQIALYTQLLGGV